MPHETGSLQKLPLLFRYVALVVCLIVVFDGLSLLVGHFVALGGLVGLAIYVLCVVGLMLQVLSLEKSGNVSSTFGLPLPPPQFLERVREDQANQSEFKTLVGWVLGLVLLVGCGWGFIAVVGYLSHAWKLGLSWETAAMLAADISLVLILILQKNLWLSRLLGLRLTSHSTQVGETIFVWLFGVVALMLRSTQAAQARDRESKPNGEVSVGREIAETVVFVVVLVLLLKAFVAQAFVIPTGSMAVTLYGYQMDVTCPKCGYLFPVNASNEVDPSDGGPPVPVEACTCPNCRYHIIFPEEMLRNPKFERPNPSTGDRVLVADFLYDLPGRHPHRLDVVVFKYPGDSGPMAAYPYPISGPQKQQSAMNYIKRLIGEDPGETIGIWHGKLYHLPAELLPPEKRDQYRRDAINNIWNARIQHAPPELKPELELRRERGEEPAHWEKELWRWENMFKDDLKDQLQRGEGFQIIRKPPAKILDMRRIVYDNDHPPEDLHGDLRDRWRPEEGAAWAQADPHGFEITASEKGTAWLHYHHVLRSTPNHKDALITDFVGYNTYEPHRGGGAPRPNWVGDLLVECDVVVEQPTGTFMLELSKGVDRFRAVWDLASGKCTLRHLNTAHPGKSAPEENRFVELANTATKLHGKGKYQVRFANIDNRLLVWVDDALPFGDGVNYEPFTEKGPYPNDLQPASIGAQAAALKVQHLSLWRDTYYTRDPSAGADAAPDDDDWSSPEMWNPLRDLAATTFYVQPGHYLCMGDNSPESSDSRSWGLVPERLMLGRALVIYYPFGRAGRIK